MYNSVVLVWFPKSFCAVCGEKLLHVVTNAFRQSYVRQQVCCYTYDTSAAQHVIDAGGVGEYINLFYFNTGFFLFPYTLFCRRIMEFGDRSFLPFFFLLRGYKSEFPLASGNVMDAQSVCRQVRTH